MADIIPFDWHRIFWGDLPLTFHFEIIFRVLVIWGWTAVLLRWIGARSISQLSVVEFLLVIGLGSAVGDSLFYPEVPLLHAMLVILLLVLLERLIDYLLIRWPHFKSVIDSRPVEVVHEGVILQSGIKVRNLSSLEVMAMLRIKGVENLGVVRSAYLEPSGGISLFYHEGAREGLPLVPPPENRRDEDEGAGYCANCGTSGHKGKCPNCGQNKWVKGKTGLPPKLR